MRGQDWREPRFPITIDEEERMKKWRCIICDYIHEGPEPPDICPECGAGRENFEEVAE